MESDSPHATSHLAPRTPLEEALSAMWREMLGRNQVGVGDNFFDLGGHSLLAAQITVRIAETAGVIVPLRWCLDTPTIAELALAVLALQVAGSGGAGDALLAELEWLDGNA